VIKLRSNCSSSSSRTVSNQRLPGHGATKATVHFQGNNLLKPTSKRVRI